MRIFTLFERRSAVIELILFCYAIGVASLVCLHMPLLSYTAVLLLLIAVGGIAYGLWWTARPDTKRAYLFFGLALTGTLVTAGLMVAFGNAVADFSVLQIHNSVTDADAYRYRTTLLSLLGLHSAITAGTVYALYALFGLGKADMARIFILQWSAMPLQFVLMKLYGTFLPLT